MSLIRFRSSASDWEGNSKDGVSGMVTLTVNGKTVYATKSTKVFCNHWIFPYNGAEYHVLVDVLPEQIILEETLYISDSSSKKLEKYLCGEEVQGFGSSLSETAKFSDGYSMDIRCCGDEDTSWTEAILYDNIGMQVAITDRNLRNLHWLLGVGRRDHRKDVSCQRLNKTTP